MLHAQHEPTFATRFVFVRARRMQDVQHLLSTPGQAKSDSVS